MGTKSPIPPTKEVRKLSRKRGEEAGGITPSFLARLHGPHGPHVRARATCATLRHPLVRGKTQEGPSTRWCEVKWMKN